MKLLARYNTAHGGTLTHIEIDDKYDSVIPNIWEWISKLELPDDVKRELKSKYVMVTRSSS